MREIVNTVYLDMDGVIANFDKRFHELYGITSADADAQKIFGGMFQDFIANGQFATLELMPDAMDLINFLRNSMAHVEILSSTSLPKNQEAVSKQKLIWLEEHGISFFPNLVPGKHLKKNWAKPNAMMIDDTKSVIDDFREAGGYTIWHSDVPTTLAILKTYSLMAPK
jgi:hypothetical protein